jgi:hypothetical protein
VRKTKMLIMTLLCLLLLPVYGQELNKKITIKIKNASLEEVFSIIQKEHQVRFSFVNNEIPADKNISIDFEDKPLAEVLDKILEGKMLKYQAFNGSIVIKKDVRKVEPLKETNFGRVSGLSEEVKKVEPSIEVVSIELNLADEIPATSEANVYQQEGLDDSTPHLQPSSVTSLRLDSTVTEPAGNFRKKQFEEIKERFKSNFNVGVNYPLSTGGVDAIDHTYVAEIHLVSSKAYGLNGGELAFVSANKVGFVNGIQLSGAYNNAGGEVSGAQIAIGFNRVEGSLKGSQVSVGFNVVGEELAGAQITTGFNLAKGYVKGVQISAGANLAQDDFEGAQVSAGYNHARNMKGAQISAGANNALVIKGSQFSLVNIAKDMKGAQISLVNVSGNMKGIQIGLINISDSIDGIPIGLLNISKKNGYSRLEFFYGDDLHANIAYKLGVKRFYNIIAAGLQVADNERYGLGLGLGSEWRLGGSFHLNTDFLSYHIIEKSYRTFPQTFLDQNVVNFLNRFRVLCTFQIGRRSALFIGPTYNVMVSRFNETPEGPMGSGLLRSPFFDQTNFKTNVKMSLGINAGIRL